MELGGKSPNVVFADADLERTIPAVVNAILQNGGQTCSAGSRLLVQESVHRAGRRHWCGERFAATTIGAPVDDPDLGPLISAVPARPRPGLHRLGARARHRRVRRQCAQRWPIRRRILRPAHPRRRRGPDQSRWRRKRSSARFLAVTPLLHRRRGHRPGQRNRVRPDRRSLDHGRVDRAADDSRCRSRDRCSSTRTARRAVVELPFGGFKQSGHGRGEGVPRVCADSARSRRR